MNHYHGYGHRPCAVFIRMHPCSSACIHAHPHAHPHACARAYLSGVELYTARGAVSVGLVEQREGALPADVHSAYDERLRGTVEARTGSDWMKGEGLRLSATMG